MKTSPRPKIKLNEFIGKDVFTVIGAVSQLLKDSGNSYKAIEFREKAMLGRSSGEILKLVNEYCEVDL